MNAPTGGAPGAPEILLMLDHDGGSAVGFHVADPRVAQIGVLDLAATRGDGIFETISIGFGRLQALEPHLERLAHSAAMLDLPVPDLAVWRAAVEAAADALAEAAGGAVAEGFVKTVLSRGVEGADIPTGWVYATLSPDHSAARQDGIRVVLLDRGYRHDVARTSPWLLAGAKTLSYAVTRAAFREAARRGADDAVWVSSDGYLLEGAVSNLILRRGDELVTPRTDLGILRGTTQGDLFAWAEGAGYRTGYALLTPDDLQAADGAWLVSSVRHAAPIRSVDGDELPWDAELSTAFTHHLTHRLH